ncbi:AraC family transcriptional regulator [Actinophytocola gossypii]|uniref:AraC family transcriptional regulator n=1 Tax=Actinophytocola gossypii TaxID=2812003 RepID=A0ABT2J4U3_9PSEU|nr:helix-turn-helix domain-containing protein [Actinophytocola gossypii]MCT2582875.1 AraC family transcriptional regulator [Actinophytocola gossypii]
MSTWEVARGALTVPGVPAAYGYFMDGVAPGLHRGLPSRYLTFLVSLDEPVGTARTRDDWERNRLARHDVVLGGLRTDPTYVRQTRRQVGIQLAVHPLAARSLFGLPAASLAALTCEGVDVLGDGVRALRERLHELPTWPRRFAALDEYLWSRAAGRHASPRPEVTAAWHQLSHGTVTITELARNTALSTRQLSALVNRELGIGPKALARLMRFDRVVAAIGTEVRAGRRPRLAEIAHGCGFSDQSHLVRDFRRFTGTSPTGFLAEELRNVQAGGHRPGADSAP